MVRNKLTKNCNKRKMKLFCVDDADEEDEAEADLDILSALAGTAIFLI